ncbi:MAG: hypothetical protein ACKVIG_16665, partial [Flavobacteriales bacterium]
MEIKLNNLIPTAKHNIMEVTASKKSLLKKIILIVLGFGPGIFAIGYTIGTGSVTSMLVAGSTYG